MSVRFVAAGSFAGNATVITQNITSPSVPKGDYLLLAIVIGKELGIFIADDGSWTNIAFGENNCTIAADDHGYSLFYKRVTADSGGTAYTFGKDIDNNTLFGGIISTWAGVIETGDPLDAAGVGVTPTDAAADNVSFPAFNPVAVDCHVIFTAIYGNDLTTFAAAMSSDTNPDCTNRFDVESGTGSDVSIALTSGNTLDGANIAARTWASVSTTDAGNTGIVFALKASPPRRCLLGVGL